MIDTHAHLNFEDFDKDLDEVISKSFSLGLEKIIVASSSLETSKKAVEIAGKNENLYASVGIHPHDIKEMADFDEIERLAGSKKVVAIGETGLDYFYLKGASVDIKEKQKNLLKKHIALAEKLDLPLIFHNRDSDEDFYNIIRNAKAKGVLHCYSGDWTFAKKILDLGFMISFTGIVTFDKTGTLAEVIKNIPLEKVMVETDAPYLAPVPYRGKRAEPWMVKEVVKKIAEIKGLSIEKVEKQTSSNAKNFFDI